MINPHFKLHGINGQNSNEQDLVNKFITETIQQLGFDVKYIPQTLVNEDPLFHENPDAVFNSATTIEAYLESVEGFEGNGDLMQSFGLDIQDQVRFHFSQVRFKEVLGMARPMEGDLIYSPLSKSLFEIKYVEHESVFYASGTLPSFQVKCEKYEMSSENFATGITEVDELNNMVDSFGDNTQIENDALALQAFDENNPFGDSRG